MLPIVVAINKCDLPEANPSMIKAELTKYEVISEDLGGDTPVVEVSAIKGDGIDDLLETLSLVAEIEELKSFKQNVTHALWGIYSLVLGVIAKLIFWE